MRYPTFYAGTHFLDSGESSTHRQVTLADTTTLEDGTVLRPCGDKELVKVETESGASLLLSPETFFAMDSAHGCLLRYLPYETVEQPEPSHRWWALVFAGAICATGRHSHERNRPSNMRVPLHLIEEYESVLNLHHISMVKSRILTQNYQSGVKVIHDADDIFVKGRALSHIVGSWLEEKTQIPPPLSKADQLPFLTGLLSSLPVTEDGTQIFSHCYAIVVEMIHLWLWRDWGVPSRLSINPMEARVTVHTSGLMPHHLVLSSEAVQITREIGINRSSPLRVMERSPHMVTMEAIAKVASIGKGPCVEIVSPVPGRKYTADSFMFGTVYDIPDEVLEIAGHPILLD